MKMTNLHPLNGKKTKGKMLKPYYTSHGTLYENDVVVVDIAEDPKTRVLDLTGRIFWVKTIDVQVIK